MARMDWLADVLRGAGLTVLEHPGWKTRGRDGMRPRVVVSHHTASFPTTPDSVVTNLLVKGRVDLPGPLCHLGLNRDGAYIVIAAGKANHAGIGAWMDANESVEAIGIEAYNWGAGVPFPSREPWPQVQLDAYDRGVAALLSHLGRDERYFCGHREWAIPNDLDWQPGQPYGGRKPDPSGIDLNAMRQRVGYLLKENPMAFTPEVETFLSDMAKAIMGAGPTTGLKGSPTSLLHVLEVHRLVAKGAANVTIDDLSGDNHLAISARLLGQ